MKLRFPTHLVVPVLVGTLLWQGTAEAGGGVVWQVGPTLPDKPTPYKVAMKIADRYAVSAAQRYQPKYRRWRLARLAVRNYELAVKADPKQAEPHLRAATLIHAHWLARPSSAGCNTFRALCLQAIDHWRKFETKAPLDPRINSFLFARALIYTQLAEKRYYRKAVKDYVRLIGSTRFAIMDSDNRGTTLSNLAEIYMMMGDVDRAIPMYVRSLAEMGKALYAYGLAVALDRDGRGAKARQVIRKYSQGDVERLNGKRTGKLKALFAPSVFFVPEGERHYYEALGYEALGFTAKAITHYEAFIRSGAHPKFHPRARENINRLKKKLLNQLNGKLPNFNTSVLPIP